MGFGDFVDEGSIVSLREPTLLVQQSQDPHWLLQQIDGGLQIETEVDELPFDPLALVLFLFEDEHSVVEELLQLLVGVVDAKLLERVDVEDLETGDIQNANEGRYGNAFGPRYG